MDGQDRPNLEGNDETSSGGAPGGTGGHSAAAALAADTNAGGDETQHGNVPYFSAGREFTKWFNSMLTKVPNPVLRLGTKTARVETLHDDGRLQVRIEGDAGKDEQQFVAFEAKYLDMVLLKFASASR